MAFLRTNWSRTSSAQNTGRDSTTNLNGMATFTYQNKANDTAATIEAANYFSGAAFDLQIGDIIFAEGSDAFTARAVAAVDTSVTPATITTTSIGLNDSIATANINAGAVTFVKIEDIATVTLLGNSTGGEQSVEEITLSTGLEFSGTTLRLKEDTIRVATVTLTAAQVLLLRATPKELVAAPGAGKVLQFLGAELLLDWVGVAYTESTANLGIKYTDGSGVQVSENIEATGFATLTADSMTNAVPVKDVIVSKTGSENKALVIHNLGAGEWANSGDSPIRVITSYRVLSTGF